MRVCSVAGCPTLVSKAGRCASCRRELEQRRGTRQQRGYDAAYDASRRRAAPGVAKGTTVCWSCLTRISPLEPWDQGHCDLDRAVIHGPQHERCNSDTSTPGCDHISHMR
jgi:hypothetical protein